jgi:GTPase
MTDACYIVAVRAPGVTVAEAEAHLDELENLCTTLEYRVSGKEIVTVHEPKPHLLVGPGQARQIVDSAEEACAEIIVFDDDLSPRQQRNWEELSSLPVIDRREIILDIFAEHASTKEASLQIELARLEYYLPRLKRAWTHLSRQRGGRRGTRGEGEKQLELDRRMILKRIYSLKNELEAVAGHRDRTRKLRDRDGVTTASLIGYTNAGKSSLLNALTEAGVRTEDKLFATLDPTTRAVEKRVDGTGEFLLTDTVGFIRKLPHDLVEAFHSTLEESKHSDILIHVIDASSPEAEAHIRTTEGVLADLGILDKPRIICFNKTDSLNAASLKAGLAARYPEAIFVSAVTGEGLDHLLDRCGKLAGEFRSNARFVFPLDRFDLVAFLHRSGSVVEEDYRDDSIEISAKVTPRTRAMLNEFTV